MLGLILFHVGLGCYIFKMLSSIVLRNVFGAKMVFDWNLKHIKSFEQHKFEQIDGAIRNCTC